MHNTNHADKRMKQRSITNEIIELLEIYGAEASAGGNATSLYFTKESRQEMRAELGSRKYKKIADRLNVYLIKNEGTIITVGHSYKKFRH